MSEKMNTLKEVAEILREARPSWDNGRCSTAVCLMRGGYSGGPVDYSLATCEGHELAQEIRRLAAMNDTSWAAQAMEGSND